LQSNHQLVCKNIKASYPQFQLDLDFKIAGGKLVSLLGPSGCGKTTTLSLIAGIIPIQTGEIILNGRDITTLEMYKRKVGLVFQDYALFPNMNVKQNLSYPLKIQKISKLEINEKITNILSMVGLEGFENRDINELSGGEKQRIAIGRAIASSPDLLLLDEPLSALDANLRTNLRKEIKKIQKKTELTTIYVTHDQEEALSLSDLIIVMKDGKIQQEGTPETIYNKPKNLFVADFIGKGNTIELNSTEKLFFRPEKVLLSQEKPSDCLELKNVKIINTEYFGSTYASTGKYKNSYITFFSSTKINKAEINLYVKKRDTLFYKNGFLFD